jgi:DNA-binding PadR family transcriptional regulator
MGTADGGSQRRKKQTKLTPLDMFLLGLVKGGLITPYDWQAKGRVSLGASLPAARRLVDAGLLLKEVSKEPGSRERHEFRLTDKGHDELDELDNYIDDASKQPPADLESVVRLACLATIKGKNDIAKEILLEASEEHRHRAKLARKRASNRTLVRSGLGALYSLVLEQCEAEQETEIANQFERLRRR